MIRTCPHCSAKNRLPLKRMLEGPKCGKCKEPLPPPEHPVPVGTGFDFRTMIRDAPVPVLVDFWAPWCGPCKAMAPEFDRLAGELKGTVLLAKVNTDEIPALGSEYAIRSIPTIILFRDGVEANRVTGAASAASLKSRLGL
jgi:thioredoxin 2